VNKLAKMGQVNVVVTDLIKRRGPAGDSALRFEPLSHHADIFGQHLKMLARCHSRVDLLLVQRKTRDLWEQMDLDNSLPKQVQLAKVVAPFWGQGHTTRFGDTIRSLQI
jgi:hypothetical protein